MQDSRRNPFIGIAMSCCEDFRRRDVRLMIDWKEIYRKIKRLQVRKYKAAYMTDRRHSTLRALLVAYSVCTASSYSQRAVVQEYGINTATVLQHALHDKMLFNKDENRQESRANGNIVHGHSNVSGSHSSRDYSVLTRMRQRREANSELESRDYDSNDLKQISANYQILATLDVAPSSFEDDREMARRWGAAINEAFMQSRARHFRQKGVPFKDIASRNGTTSTENTLDDAEPELDIQILGTECSADGCVQSFAVVYNGQLVPAEVIASDLSLISLSHISAHLMLPVRKISMAIKRGHNNESQWWIIAIVGGGGIAIVMCGWLMLFVYYNTCGRPYRATEESSLVKKVYLKDEPAQTEMESAASEATYDGQHSYENKHQSSLHEEVFSDVQLPAVTSIEYQGKENVTEILATKSEPSFSQQTKGPVFSKTESAPPDEAILDNRFTENTQRHPSQVRIDRPMSARPTRPIRSIEGCIIDKSGPRQTDKEWSPYFRYFTGDEVYRICGFGAMTSYPRPIPMSSNGILEVSSLADTVGSTPMRYL